MTTPRKTPPVPVGGALVPSMPSDVRDALAAIVGDQCAAQLACAVWGHALDWFGAFATDYSAQQKQAWLRHADRLFSAAVKARPAQREKRRGDAIKYVMSLPDAMPYEIVHVLAVPVAQATSTNWRTAIDTVRKRSGMAVPNRKGPHLEAVETARLALPIFSSLGIKPGASDSSIAVQALHCMGKGIAGETGTRALSIHGWRVALSAARKPATILVENRPGS